MLRNLSKRFIRDFKNAGFFGKSFRLLLVAGMLTFLCLLVLVLAVWAGFFGKLPDREELARIRNPIASEVYSADSVLLGRFYLEERSPVDSTELPRHLKYALLATEDVRFYQHNGIDLKSLARVAVKTILLQDESSGGGSTLTQQLAKNLYRRKRYAFLSLPINKIREFLIARKIENVYTKDEILLLYLNTISFADNTFGVKTAANRFFSKPVKALTVDEAAILVGMLKATHSYNPRLFPERSLKRRNVVISQMEKYGFINEAESERLQALPLTLHYNHTNYNVGAAPYFRAFIQRELLAWCQTQTNEDGNPYNLYTDGLKIYTTIDSRMQAHAEQAVRQEMARIQKTFITQLNKRTVDEVVNSKIASLSQYRALKASGLSHEEILKQLSAPIKTRMFFWEGEREEEQSVLDSLRHHLQFLQTGVLAMSPDNGAIRVWIGGIDHRYFKYDHVRKSTKRQVGSTIKPLIYAAALESGIGPCDYIPARKTSYSNMEGWTPANTDEETYERKYSMEGGLAESINTVSVALLEKTGVRTAISTLRKLGIESDLPPVPSLALGTPSISMMEMVSAYAALVNDGIAVKPWYISSIVDRYGKMIVQYEPDTKGTQALSAESSRMIVDMLQTAVSEGTGASLRSVYGLTNDLAGKTGTTQSNVDGWFIAMMPRLVVGAWVGSDDPRLHFQRTAQGQGAATALPIVARFLQRMNKDHTLDEVTRAVFPPLSDELERKLDCRQSRSNTNIFQRIFKKKKGTKEKDFDID